MIVVFVMILGAPIVTKLNTSTAIANPYSYCDQFVYLSHQISSDLDVKGVSARKVVMMSEVVNPCNKDHIAGHMPTSKPTQAKRWITSCGDKLCFVFHI